MYNTVFAYYQEYIIIIEILLYKWNYWWVKNSDIQSKIASDEILHRQFWVLFGKKPNGLIKWLYILFDNPHKICWTIEDRYQTNQL